MGWSAAGKSKYWAMVKLLVKMTDVNCVAFAKRVLLDTIWAAESETETNEFTLELSGSVSKIAAAAAVNEPDIRIEAILVAFSANEVK